MGREILLSGQDSDLSSLGAYGGDRGTRVHLAYHLLHQCSHPPSWGHIPLPPPCMGSMGFHPHIPGSCPCLRFCPHQSGVSSPPEVSSSPSMVHDHTFAAAWRVVGGCCFYEGKGPLVRSWGEC